MTGSESLVHSEIRTPIGVSDFSEHMDHPNSSDSEDFGQIGWPNP